MYDISKLPKDKQEENAGLIVMVTWIAPFLIVMLLLLTIKSISQDRAQERYYISRTKHESEKGIK